MTPFLLLQSSGFDPVQVVASSSGVAKATLLLLGAMSVAAWALWGSRRLALLRLTRETKSARDALVRASDAEALADAGRALAEGPARRMFLAVAPDYRDVLRAWSASGNAPDEAQVEAGRELLARVLATARAREMLVARRGVTPLATIGSTAPFIGLFGTVWGVIDAFESIGTAGSASLAVVAPGVAEALVATGAGLVAAVPAVWFYNGLSAALRRFGAELEAVGAEVLNCYDRGVAAGGRARTPASPQSAWER